MTQRKTAARKATDDQAAEQPPAAADLATIRVFTGVSGLDFSWKAGDEVTLPAAEAAKWADGVRARLVD